jgi:hypothetical protein
VADPHRFRATIECVEIGANGTKITLAVPLDDVRRLIGDHFADLLEFTAQPVPAPPPPQIPTKD